MTTVMSTGHRVLRGPVDIVALGWALSATLVVLFVICLAVALMLPGLTGSHAWVGLFSVAPVTSLRVWVDGIVYSIVFGWISAAVFGVAYNGLASRDLHAPSGGLR